MSQHYNRNYTWEQVTNILAKIHECIKEGRFYISKNENRKENLDFITEYNLSSRRQREILLKIKVEDFCHSLKNTKAGYEREILYVFCPQVRLYSLDDIEEEVDIYTKFNLIVKESGKRVVVISLHKRNKPIDYLFR